MEIPFAVQSYKHDAKKISQQRCINAYAEVQPKGSKAQIAVLGPPGIDPFSTIGTGPIRGFKEMNEIAYIVSGSQFFSFDRDGVSTLLGGGITGFGVVSMDGTGFEIVIVNGSFGYSYLLSDGSFVQISDPDFHPANTVTVINNTFVFDWSGTNKFFTSNILDGRTYTGTDFASAESDPDFVRAVKAHNGTLFLLGAKSIEPWDNTGAADFAFSRIKGGTVARGIASSLAVAEEDSSLFFLGNDLIAYRLNGLQPLRISTFAIEHEWSSYGTTTDAFMMTHGDSGHKFITLTFPTENKTWVFDIATALWHERMSYDAGGREVKWRINCIMTVYNNTYFGDANTSKVGVINRDHYTEFGDPIITVLISPPIFDQGKEIAVPCFEIDMEVGVGTTSGQGSDPQVMLDYSFDGGYNYEGQQEWASMGPIGNRKTRIEWRELGSATEYVFRLTISDPVRRTLHGARVADIFASY